VGQIDIYQIFLIQDCQLSSIESGFIMARLLYLQSFESKQKKQKRGDMKTIFSIIVTVAMIFLSITVFLWLPFVLVGLIVYGIPLYLLAFLPGLAPYPTIAKTNQRPAVPIRHLKFIDTTRKELRLIPGSNLSYIRVPLIQNQMTKHPHLTKRFNPKIVQ
jgi:hypothetical protein